MYAISKFSRDTVVWRSRFEQKTIDFYRYVGTGDLVSLTFKLWSHISKFEVWNSKFAAHLKRVSLYDLLLCISYLGLAAGPCCYQCGSWNLGLPACLLLVFYMCEHFLLSSAAEMSETTRLGEWPFLSKNMENAGLHCVPACVFTMNRLPAD
jgi:hypothetical protein